MSLAAPLAQWAPPAPHTVPLAIRFAAGWLILMALVTLSADVIAPYPFAEQHLTARFRLPAFAGGGWDYPLGTDHLGRDMLSRLIYAVRTSMLIALAGTMIGAVFGAVLGFAAARWRGLLDHTVMLMVEAQAALPALFVALGFLAFFGNNIVLFVIVVSLEGWERYTRLVRGLVATEQSSDYIRAVVALGASPMRVIARHLLPNILASLVVQVSLNFPGTILLETSLSFLGLGVQPPGASLGLMLGEGRRYLLSDAWVAVLPGLAILLTTLSMCIFGDWLRDRLDPTLDQPQR